MCKAMKQKYNLGHVITGAPWDIEKVILGAFSDTGYFTYGERNGEILPGYATDEYKDILELEYEWAKEGINFPGKLEHSCRTGRDQFYRRKNGSVHTRSVCKAPDFCRKKVQKRK